MDDLDDLLDDVLGEEKPKQPKKDGKIYYFLQKEYRETNCYKRDFFVFNSYNNHYRYN